MTVGGRDPGFRHLNVDGRWPAFATRNLVRTGVDLVLAPVPHLDRVVTVVESEGAIAALAVAPEGDLFLVDAATQRVLRVHGCDGAVEPLPCFGGEGVEPGRLREASGLAVGAGGRLFVADSGNHRIQVVDLAAVQVVAVWGQADAYAPPVADVLVRPTAMAVAPDGTVYVADPDNGAVVGFAPDGTPVASLAAGRPVGVTLATGADGAAVVLVLDAEAPALLAYRPDGSTAAPPLSLPVTAPTALAVTAERLYVGDAAGTVTTLTRDGAVLGTTTVARDGGIVAMVVDGDGRLLVAAGGAVHRLLAEEGRVADGAFLGGPFAVADHATDWQVLRLVRAQAGEGDAHVRLFTLVTDLPVPMTLAAAEAAWATLGPPPAVFSAPGEWRVAPRDEDTIALLHHPGRYLWVGGLVTGDGRASPVLHRMRVEFDGLGWAAHLPAVYRRQGRAGPLRQVLDGLRSRLEEDEALIASMAARFDPRAVPDDGPGSWLDWLAGWVAVELDEAWDDERRRAVVEAAFAAHGRRGTVHGLVEVIAARLGIPVRIEEPPAWLVPWALGETSVLGFGTMLSAADPQGATVGTTAQLGRTHLLDPADYGAPSFEPLANRFCVQALAADVCDGPQGAAGLDALERLVSAEKPAHTTAHVCVVGPRLSVGAQARVGVDAIVGGPPDPFVVGEGGELGVGTVLGGRRTDAVVGVSTVTG